MEYGVDPSWQDPHQSLENAAGLCKVMAETAGAVETALASIDSKNLATSLTAAELGVMMVDIALVSTASAAIVTTALIGGGALLALGGAGLALWLTGRLSAVHGGHPAVGTIWDEGPEGEDVRERAKLAVLDHAKELGPALGAGLLRGLSGIADRSSPSKLILNRDLFALLKAVLEASEAKIREHEQQLSLMEARTFRPVVAQDPSQPSPSYGEGAPVTLQAIP